MAGFDLRALVGFVLSHGPGAIAPVTKRTAIVRPVLETYDHNGKQYRHLDAYGRQWSNHYSEKGSGFGYLKWSEDREIGYDYPDIGFGHRVTLRKGLAQVLFDGFLVKIEEIQEDKDRITCTALGWSSLFGDDTFNKIYCETRLGQWVGSEEPAGSFRPDKFDYRMQDSIYLKPRQVDFDTDEYTYVRYEIPFSSSVARIRFDWEVALPDAWPGKLEVRDSTGAILLSETATGSGSENIELTGTVTYIEARFYVTEAGENTAADGTVYGQLTNVRVYSVDDEIVDAGVVAKDIAGRLATNFGLDSDTSKIASPNVALDSASAFDTDMTPEQIMNHCCQFGDANGNRLAWGVEMNDRRRVFLETQDTTTVKYIVRRYSGLRAQVSADWKQSYQKTYGIWTDEAGIVRRTDDQVDQDAIDRLGGLFRRRGLRLDGITDEDTVLTALNLNLSENSDPKVASSFSVAGHVYSADGGRVPVDELQAGGIVLVDEFRAREAAGGIVDYRSRWTSFMLVGVEIDEDAGTAKLIPAGDANTFEQYMAMLTKLRQD